jgi:multiple sugar transport system permease protein
MNNGKIQHLIFSLFRLIFLLSISYIIVFPLLYMVSNSIKPLDQLIDPSVVWLPKNVTFDNFKLAAKAMNYWHSFLVSLRVDVVSALIQVFTCSFIAYGFARFRFKGNTFLFGLVLLTIIVPSQATIIPTYLNFTNVDFLEIVSLLRMITGQSIKINLIDSAATFYLPSLFGVGLRSGLFIFIYRQFYRNLPRELEEAAWIDGAGSFKTYFRIVLPLSGVAMLTVAIFSIVWHWNDYYLSSMYFSENFPLAVSLSQIRSGLQSTAGISENGNPVLIRSMLMAGCIMFIAPVLLMYLFLQKYFIKSIETVGIVG